MQDIKDIIKAVENVYDNDTAFTILKDFERVLDQLDLYVYDNWENGELVAGPEITRHFITCSFMWPREEMPDPMGGKRLLDYDCKVSFARDKIIKPRKIRKPDDIRPMTKKGKLDTHPIWIVEIMMPKKLIADIYSGYKALNAVETDVGTAPSVAPTPETEPVEAGAEATADAVETV